MPKLGKQAMLKIKLAKMLFRNAFSKTKFRPILTSCKTCQLVVVKPGITLALTCAEARLEESQRENQEDIISSPRSTSSAAMSMSWPQKMTFLAAFIKNPRHLDGVCSVNANC